MRVSKILNVSTHNEECGIGKYQEMYLKAFQDYDDIETRFFAHSPNQMKVLSEPEFKKVMQELRRELKTYDVLHVQHEFSFYFDDQLDQIISAATSLHKTVIVTVHTSPEVLYQPATLRGIGLRSFLRYLRDRKRASAFLQSHIDPLKKANLIIVHNAKTGRALSRFGVEQSLIRELKIPVPEVSFTMTSDEIHRQLDVKPNDVVLCVVGFLAATKGVTQAVKALSYLPDNFKLAIIGGVHPVHGDAGYYEVISDLIVTLGLANRVYVTGFVKDDDELNALIRECDVCVYPYDKNYYSNVSSAALNNSFANHSPVIAYPTDTFKELNSDSHAMVLTKSFDYYELARELKSINLTEYAQASARYAAAQSYSVLTHSLADIYRSFTSDAS